MTDPLYMGANRVKDLLETAGISPAKDPDFPYRMLCVDLNWEKAWTYADLFNRGELPNPLEINEQALRRAISVLRSHYLYGRWKHSTKERA